MKVTGGNNVSYDFSDLKSYLETFITKICQ